MGKNEDYGYNHLQDKSNDLWNGNRSKDAVVKIDGLALENVSSYRYLGITLDENLSFSLQVDNAVCKVLRGHHQDTVIN